MFDLLTGDDLYAEVILLLGDGDGKAVVLVEGPDDLEALDSHIDTDSCHAIPGYGKSSVVQAISLADLKKPGPVLAILDRDWVGILEKGIESTNIVYTDWYDLDATILKSGDNYLRVATSFSDLTVMRQHIGRAAGDKVLDLIVPAAVAVGAIRLIAREESKNLRARDFPVGEIIDLRGGDPDLKKAALIAASKASASLPRENVDSVADALAAKYARIGANYRYCSGHDLLVALAVIMRKRWKSSASAKTVAQAVRAAFACSELMRTALFADVKEWGLKNSISVWNCPELLAHIPEVPQTNIIEN